MGVWRLRTLSSATAACGGNGESEGGDAGAAKGESAAPAPSVPVTSVGAAPEALNPADFSPTIDHPLFPLPPSSAIEFAGTERDAEGETVKTRTEKRLLDRTETVAGVRVAVLEVKDFEDGELIELTEDYYAQHRDGSVWYFGERVSDYEDGKVAGHEGQWFAGEGKNRASVFMPAQPVVGQEFDPEVAPGVAEERAKVLALDIEVASPAGKFTGCMKTEVVDLLDKVTEFATYCPQVGLVRNEGPSGMTQLVRIA